MSERIERDEVNRIITALCERFGVDESVFEDCALYLGSKGKVYLHHLPAPEIVGAAIVGMHIATVAKTVKPTTNFFQTFGRHLRKNVVHVSSDVAREMIIGQEVLALPQDCEEVTTGYVAIACDGRPFMCAFLKDGEIRNMLSKGRRRVVELI